MGSQALGYYQVTTTIRKFYIVVIVIIVTMTTTIQVTNEFKDWLEQQGKKGETYEDILKRLIKYGEVQQGDVMFSGVK